MEAQRLKKVNVGCGQTPTPGWVNLDNSLTVRFARVIQFLPISNREFARAALARGIRYADATRLPLSSSSVAVIYSSHMMEHLDRARVAKYLAEAMRVLVPGGIIRCAVPDLKRQVDDYLRSGDANRFIDEMHMSQEQPVGIARAIATRITAFRDHRWMYDEASLTALLTGSGFVDVVALPPGKTTIPDPGELNLFERADGTLYVEGKKPLR